MNKTPKTHRERAGEKGGVSRPRLRSPGEVLAALRKLQKARGFPPTVRELAEDLELGSTRTALRYLRDLEYRGWITRWPGARGIRINAPDDWDPSAPEVRLPDAKEGQGPVGCAPPVTIMVSGDFPLTPENQEWLQEVADAAMRKMGWR